MYTIYNDDDDNDNDDDDGDDDNANITVTIMIIRHVNSCIDQGLFTKSLTAMISLIKT